MNKSNYNTTKFNVVIFFLLLNYVSMIKVDFTSTLSQTSISLLLMINILYLFLYYMKSKQINKYVLAMIVGTILFVIFISLNTFNDYGKLRMFIRIFQFLGLVSILINTSNTSNPERINLTFYMILNYFMIFFIYYTSLINRNYIGSIGIISDISFGIMSLNFLFYKAKMLRGIYVVIFLPVFFITNARTHIIVICYFILLQLLWRSISNRKVTYYVTFSLILGSILGITAIYPNLKDVPFFIRLNQLTNYYTGENFFSGRQVIWKYMLDSVENHELTGLGSNIVVQGEYSNDLLSSHNQYLEIYVQNGLIGLSIFIAILFVIWNLHFRNRFNIFSKYTITLLASLMIMGITSVSLYQINMAFASMLWFTLGLGTSFAFKSYRID